jgi:hypothetical protein
MWQFRTTLSLPEKSATRAASTGFLRKLVGRETDARGVALPPAGGQERTINQALSLFGASSSWEFRRVCQQFLGKSGELGSTEALLHTARGYDCRGFSLFKVTYRF